MFIFQLRLRKRFGKTGINRFNRGVWYNVFYSFMIHLCSALKFAHSLRLYYESSVCLYTRKYLPVHLYLRSDIRTAVVYSSFDSFCNSSVGHHISARVDWDRIKCQPPHQEAPISSVQVLSYNCGRNCSNLQLHEDLEVPYLAEHIRYHAQNFDSKILDSENLLVLQFARHFFYPRHE